MQSWEDKLKKADESELVLKKSFENMGVSMQEPVSIAFRPHKCQDSNARYVDIYRW